MCRIMFHVLVSYNLMWTLKILTFLIGQAYFGVAILTKAVDISFLPTMGLLWAFQILSRTLWDTDL